MGKTNIIFLAAMLLVLVALLVFSIFGLTQITGGSIKNHYTYTKAVCNETNYCGDYEITCENDEIISMIFTGAAIQLTDSWKDPRDKETIERIC